MSRERARPKTRERILEAALDLFAEEGFKGTTIAEIERRVGLAAGTGSLYRHFPSKEALLRAAVEHEVSRCRAEIERARRALPPTEDPGERRVQQFEQMLVNIRLFDRLFRLMLNEGDRVPELKEAIWTAVQRPAKEQPGTDEATEAIAMAALGGYHLFSMMQGRPFNNVSQELFVRTLVGLVGPGRERPPPSGR
jgi:AcrR family transcriptional regulator